MIYDWYKIFNKAEFEAEGLVSKTYTLELEELGLRDVLVTQGVGLGVTYEGIFLPASLNDENPFAFEGHAVYLDANDDVHLGIQVDES